jgi:hypothetical protein
VTRIAWSTAAEGAEVIPILLIAGVPAIFYPEGVTVTGLSISGAPAEWWPGNTYANWTAYGKAWLSLRGDGIAISERAQPTQTQQLDVSEVTVYLADIPDGGAEYGASTLFSNTDNLLSTYLAATLSATATTITVTSTGNFPASGTVYLGQEAITYTGKTATTFTGCTRGAFGSTATRHLYDEAAGTGLGNPVVLNGSDEIIGRPATLWLAEVTAGVITKLSLEHMGNVGTGAALASDGEGWVIHVDHAIKRLGQKINERAISVQGYVHAGSLNARTTLQPPYAGSFCPLYVSAASSAGIVALAILTGDAAAPDRGGWHPSRESFIADFAAAGQASFAAVGANFSAALDTNGALRVVVRGFGAVRNLVFFKPWATPINDSATSVTSWNFAVTTAMPKAYVPIFTDSPVYVTQGDYASVPAVPTPAVDWPTYNAEVYYCLVMEDDNDAGSRKVARITGVGTSGGAYFLTCTALAAPAVTVPGYYAGLMPAPGDRGGPRRSGFVISEPTTARLGLYTKADTWVKALQFAMQVLGEEFASVIGAIDFDDMEDVASVYPSALRGAREYVIDLDVTPLEILANEATLNGFALVMRNGKVSITRVAEFAITELTDYSLSSDDLKRDGAVPDYEKGADGIVNTFTVRVPEQSLTLNVVDATSRGRYGTRGGMEATFPRGTVGGSADASRLYVQIFAQAATVLGPHRYPYEHVTVRVPLHKYDAQVGDLVLVTSLWRIPNRTGGRGLTNQMTQVVGREVSLYAEMTDGWVAYTLRLNPSNVQGYAPVGLVDANGIAGAVVTFDGTTFGTGGFAGPTYADGGASTFLVGDLVRLVEIDATTPTTSTQHTVTAVSGATITLNPAPAAPFPALSVDPLKIMVVFDDWSVVAARPSQTKYGYLSDASYSLDGAARAGRVFAA